jgi:hypothetical protein
MAIYHANTKPVSRAKGHSATANASYIGSKSITDERTGVIYDYSKKTGVIANEIILPDSAINFNDNDNHNNISNPNKLELDSSTLWNKAEQAEKRKDARVGREWEVSLPYELSNDQRQELAKEITRNIANRYGVACEYAIHAPVREGSDLRNHHVHILTTTRKIDYRGNLGDKADIELKNEVLIKADKLTTDAQIKEVREQIANTINKHLALGLINTTVSHKTLKEQGINREPTTHKGKSCTEQERRTNTMVKGLVDRVNKLTKIIKDFGIGAKYKGVLSSAMEYLKDNHVKIKSSTEIGQELKNKQEMERVRQLETEKSKQKSLGKVRGFGVSEGQGYNI